MSEVMLRRTRAAQVVAVYAQVLREYPSAKKLATATESDIRELLYPLGLAWRAGNVAAMASELGSYYSYRVPTDPTQLRRLTGVGEYVANAVACFAAGKPVLIVDTNVVRVIGRIFGLSLKGEARRRKEMKDAAAACLHRKRPADYNYALLDFAALVCRARNPLCDDCPFGGRGKCEHALSAG